MNYHVWRRRFISTVLSSTDADVDTVEVRDGVIVTESLVASSELYSLCMHQYIV
jgi:hypothetical protein